MRSFFAMLLALTFVWAAPGSAMAGDRQDQCSPGDAFCNGVPQAHGDDQDDSVVTEGSQGVQFPGVGLDSDVGRATADNAACADCHWTVAPLCMQNGPGDDSMCLGATIGCPDPAVRFRVYLRHGTGPWQMVGVVCLGPGQRPRSVADVGEAVRERVVSLLPDADPSFQPVSGGIVNLPTLFAAGEPESMTTQPFDVLGFTVVVTATARWEWSFDRGVTEGFDRPGGAYPNQDVAYTYEDTGSRQVSVTTYWKATFTIDGEGPFAVPGPEIQKTAGPITVPVRQAAAELVGG
jgi:hypothetical protein